MTGTGFGKGKGGGQIPPASPGNIAALAQMMGAEPPPGGLTPGTPGWLPGSGAPLLSSVNPNQRASFLAQTAYANANRAPGGQGANSMEQDRLAFVRANEAAAAAQAAAAAEAARRAAEQQRQAAWSGGDPANGGGGSGVDPTSGDPANGNGGGFNTGSDWGPQHGGLY